MVERVLIVRKKVTIKRMREWLKPGPHSSFSLGLRTRLPLFYAHNHQWEGTDDAFKVTWSIV